MKRSKKPKKMTLRQQIEQLTNELSRAHYDLQEQKNRLALYEKSTEFVRDNFSLAITIMNTTRQNLKDLARQAAKEKNPTMACVFEFLYIDMANLGKYKRLMKCDNSPSIDDTVPPINFGREAQPSGHPHSHVG